MDLYGNWGGGTRFSCKLCWYSIEHIHWLNGFTSSRVQGIEWALNHHAAARYAVDTDRMVSPDQFSCWKLMNIIIAVFYFPCHQRRKRVQAWRDLRQRWPVGNRKTQQNVWRMQKELTGRTNGNWWRGWRRNDVLSSRRIREFSTNGWRYPG